METRVEEPRLHMYHIEGLCHRLQSNSSMTVQRTVGSVTLGLGKACMGYEAVKAQHFAETVDSTCKVI